MSRYIWLFISFFLLSTFSMTYTSAMDGEYAPTDGALEDSAEQGEDVAGRIAGENGEVQVAQEDEVTRELKTKQHVRNIVDSLLKINKQVEVRSDDPKVKRLMKEQNIGKQIDRLRADIKDLENTLNSHYTEIKKSSEQADEEKQEEKEGTAKQNKSKVAAKTSKHTAGSWRKARHPSTRSRSATSDIHTVKNVAVPATNSYLQRINQRKAPVTSSKTTIKRTDYSYKVKCYGKGGRCGSAKTTTSTASTAPQATTSYSVKKVDYFNPNCGTRSCK